MVNKAKEGKSILRLHGTVLMGKTSLNDPETSKRHKKTLTCRLKPSLGGTERGVKGGAQAGGGTTTGQTLAEDRVGGIGEGS